MSCKIPISALVVVYARDLRVLLMERADFGPGHWQSVTGSQQPGEALLQTATRELFEETGIDAGAYGGVVDWGVSNEYEIFPQRRYRYAPGVTHNTEHAFGLELPDPVAVTLAPKEHLRYAWLPWQEAAARCFSWSNRDAILMLPQRAGAGPDQSRVAFPFR